MLTDTKTSILTNQTLVTRLFSSIPVVLLLFQFSKTEAQMSYSYLTTSNGLRTVATYNDSEAWCYCVRDKNGQYAGAIPMAGYGAGAYIIALFEYYEGVDE